MSEKEKDGEKQQILKNRRNEKSKVSQSEKEQDKTQQTSQNWMQELFGSLSFLSKIDREKWEKAAIIFLLGIFFLLAATPVSLLSGKTKQEKTESVTEESVAKTSENNEYIDELENKLEQTIAGMEGAGKVLVMITLKDDGEKILDKNEPYESKTEKVKEDGKESEITSIQSDKETVLVEQDGDTTPFVVQVKYPEIEGVVVVCEGGDDSALALRIKEAVQALFSIDAHKVVVCKLKQE
jgi:stage III sporulation protein AG